MLAGVFSGLFVIGGCGKATAENISSQSRLKRGVPHLHHDPRIRFVQYGANRVYQLHGYVGYEIDLQFARGERFVGLGVGDAKGVKVAAAENHLFIKPLAPHVLTDMTVITNRRTYVFRYHVNAVSASSPVDRIVYVVRFEYPGAQRASDMARRRRLQVDRDLYEAEHARSRNKNYWFCGARSLKPSAAWDDGVETHLIFPGGESLPAVFALNADGSESLVNFDMRGDQMVIHRIARRLVLRRGRLFAWIVNRGFRGGGRRLRSGTLSRRVWRVTRGMHGATGNPSRAGRSR